MGVLTGKEEDFVTNFIESRSQTVAYRHAYDVSNMKDATVHNNAYKVINRDHVQNEIKTRIDALALSVHIDQQFIINKYMEIVDDYATGVELSKSNKKKDQSTAYRMANFVNSASAVASLKAVAEMLGLQVPSVQGITQGVTINIINPVTNNISPAK